jgi:integrase
VFDDPKTAASVRTIPIPDVALRLLTEWKRRATHRADAELVFSTASGKPISPNNVLRRSIWPACQAAGLQRVTWLTFRRTYSSWAHDKGVPAKVIAQVMGHTKVDTTMNVYTQVLDGAARAAADRVGTELFRIVQSSEGTTDRVH